MDLPNNALPENLDKMAETRILNGSSRFYTNPRFAEQGVGFCTISGLSFKDLSSIWLFENVPSEASGLDRYVLTIV